MKRAAVALAFFACGCSLEERGLQATLDGAPPIDAAVDSTIGADATIDDSGPSTDVTILPDVNQDAPTPDAGPCLTPPTLCPALTGGAKIVIFETSTSQSCPSGWAKADLVTNPVALGGACSCRCNATAPTCKPTQLTITDGANAGCGGGTTSQVSYSGNCANVTLNNKAYLQVGKVTPVNGGCTADTLANGTQVTFDVVRACTPPPSCLGDVCGGAVPSGFAACVDLPGNVPCTVSGYPNRTVVGNGATLNCNLGTCACGATTSCGGNVQFFGQPNCAVLTTTIQADDVCAAGNFQNGSTSQSVRYNGTPLTTCQSSGAAVADPGLAAVHTICCK